jgi:hypothetical protein
MASKKTGLGQEGSSRYASGIGRAIQGKPGGKAVKVKTGKVVTKRAVQQAPSAKGAIAAKAKATASQRASSVNKGQMGSIKRAAAPGRAKLRGKAGEGRMASQRGKAGSGDERGTVTNSRRVAPQTPSRSSGGGIDLGGFARDVSARYARGAAEAGRQISSVMPKGSPRKETGIDRAMKVGADQNNPLHRILNGK